MLPRAPRANPAPAFGECGHTLLSPSGNILGQTTARAGVYTICITCVYEEALTVFSLLQFLHGFHRFILSELSRDKDFPPNHFLYSSSFISSLTRKQSIVINNPSTFKQHL